VIRLDPLKRDRHGDLVAIEERRRPNEREYDDGADEYFLHVWFLL
jgi:hypothetical protein